MPRQMAAAVERLLGLLDAPAWSPRRSSWPCPRRRPLRRPCRARSRPARSGSSGATSSDWCRARPRPCRARHRRAPEAGPDRRSAAAKSRAPMTAAPEPVSCRQIGRPADFLHRLVGLEDRLRSVTGLATMLLVGQPQDGLVDPPVQRLEEMVRLQPELDVLDQPVVDHQRAQQRGLRLDILRQCRCSRRLGGLGDSDYFGHGSSWPVTGRPANENISSTEPGCG